MEEIIYWRSHPYYCVPGLTNTSGKQVYRSSRSGALGVFNHDQNWRKCERVVKGGLEYVRVDGAGSERSYRSEDTAAQMYRSTDTAAQGAFSVEGSWYEYVKTEDGRKVFRSEAGWLVWEDGSAYMHRSTPEEELERSHKEIAYAVIGLLVLFILSIL